MRTKVSFNGVHIGSIETDGDEIHFVTETGEAGKTSASRHLNIRFTNGHRDAPIKFFDTDGNEIDPVDDEEVTEDEDTQNDGPTEDEEN